MDEATKRTEGQGLTSRFYQYVQTGEVDTEVERKPVLRRWKKEERKREKKTQKEVITH